MTHVAFVIYIDCLPGIDPAGTVLFSVIVKNVCWSRLQNRSTQYQHPVERCIIRPWTSSARGAAWALTSMQWEPVALPQGGCGPLYAWLCWVKKEPVCNCSLKARGPSAVHVFGERDNKLTTGGYTSQRCCMMETQLGSKGSSKTRQIRHQSRACVKWFRWAPVL